MKRQYALSAIRSVGTFSTLSVATLALVWGCDRGGVTESTGGAEPAQASPDAPIHEADCVVDLVERQLTGAMLTNAEGTCSVFLPEPWEVTGLRVAISADSSTNALALERVTESGDTLYASEGEVDLRVEGAKLTGMIRGVDSNEPAVGALYVRVDVEAP